MNRLYNDGYRFVGGYGFPDALTDLTFVFLFRGEAPALSVCAVIGDYEILHKGNFI